MPARNPFRFFIELRHQQLWIFCWVYYLIILNCASVLFWNKPLAKVIFFTFIISAFSIMGLFSRFGYAKIMGLGHIFWVPLVFFLFQQINYSSGKYRSYLIVLTLSIIISLIFDTVDVWKYFTRKKSLR